MTIRSQSCDATNMVISRKHTFGYADRKQRVLGAQVSTYEQTFTPALPDDVFGSCVEPGHYFAYRAQALRDGLFFGAFHHPKYFATAAERDKAVASYLDGAKKRAAKIASAGL